MKLPYLFIPSETATLGPKFAVEDLPLDRTATLVLAFAVKDLPFGRTLMMMVMMMMTNIKVTCMQTEIYNIILIVSIVFLKFYVFKFR